MIIGLLQIDLYLPFSHSLKDKRKRIKGLKDRLHVRYNVSYAELDFQDKWQRARIGLVAINNRRAVVDSLFQKILRDIEENLEGEITSARFEYF